MDSFRYYNKESLYSLPITSGVYALCSPEEILYIGKATNLRSRIKNHFQQSSYRDNLFINQVTRVGYRETPSEIDALVLEALLIKQEQPRYNIMWRDDKSYFYVAITKEELPRVFVTHQPSLAGLRSAQLTNQAEYIGPFTSGRQLKKVLRLLRRIFPYYTQKNHSKTPCQYCNLGMCPGPNPDPKQYKQNINRLKNILQGKRSSVLKTLEREMKQAAQQERFERAGELRDQYLALQNVFAHASLFSPQDVALENTYKEAEQELRELLGTEQPISRIEAYDISNIQGKQATGSMPVFISGRPAKQHYRKFKIRIGDTPNDFAMMQEVISRRLQHPEWEYPDLMIIDGGKGQLNAALSALRNSKFQETNSKLQTNKNARPKLSDIKVAALAKKQNELFLPGREASIPLSTLKPATKNLLMHIRDEAHRFAITYHRKLRSIDIKTG